MYKIVLSRINGVLDVTISAYWTAAIAEAFCAELRDRVRSVLNRRDGYVILLNLDDALVAPAETIAILAQIMSDPAHEEFRARLIAFYTHSPLGRLQLARLALTSDRLAVFDDREPAKVWLVGRTSAAA